METKFALKYSEPDLNEIEKLILEDTKSLLKLIDKQVLFWTGTPAVKTIGALNRARVSVMSFHDAIVRRDHESQTIISAIVYFKDMILFVNALRAPTAKQDDVKGNQLRLRIIQDRQEFKRLLTTIATRLPFLLDPSVITAQ